MSGHCFVCGMEYTPDTCFYMYDLDDNAKVCIAHDKSIYTYKKPLIYRRKNMTDSKPKTVKELRKQYNDLLKADKQKVSTMSRKDLLKYFEMKNITVDGPAPVVSTKDEKEEVFESTKVEPEIIVSSSEDELEAREEQGESIVRVAKPRPKVPKKKAPKPFAV